MKLKNLFQPILFIFILSPLFFQSCDYSNEEELFKDDNNPVNNPVVNCDTLAITYSATILPIIDGNCFRCHDQRNATDGVIVEGYNNLKKIVDDGRLLAVIEHAPGVTPMPFGGAKLSDCQIKKIRLWIEAGAPNN